MPNLLKVLLAFGLITVFHSPSFGDNWPCWRGPNGDGTSHDVNVAIDWDGASGRNILWKTQLEGEGHSSPIVWEDRIFVTACIKATNQRTLTCFDRKTGQPIWQRDVLKAGLESKHALNSYASSTPATDGQLIYMIFLERGNEEIWAPNVGGQRKIFPGKIVVAAYDFDGNQKWLVRPGTFISAHGLASSPVIYKQMLIVNGDHDGDSFLTALNKQTGEEIWRTPRRHKTRSYCTPLIRNVNGKMQMVLSGSKCIASFDPDTGSRIWNVEGPTEQFVATMVHFDNKFYAVGGYPTHHVMAVKPDGNGDVSESHVVWHKQNARCYVPSPIVVDGHLLVADDRGTANCFAPQTGERLWQTRLGKHYSASLVAANGLAYFLADDGIMKIVRPGTKPNVIATNHLGENTYSSPAIVDGQLIIRGEKHLYCIAKSTD